MPIIRRISRHGPSAQVTIPPEIMEFLDVRRGDYVVWTFGRDGSVIIDKLTPKKYPGYYTLSTHEIQKNGRK